MSWDIYDSCSEKLRGKLHHNPWTCLDYNAASLHSWLQSFSWCEIFQINTGCLTLMHITKPSFCKFQVLSGMTKLAGLSTQKASELPFMYKLSFKLTGAAFLFCSVPCLALLIVLTADNNEVCLSTWLNCIMIARIYNIKKVLDSVFSKR